MSHPGSWPLPLKELEMTAEYITPAWVAWVPVFLYLGLGIAFLLIRREDNDRRDS